jgi:hypothetical protein
MYWGHRFLDVVFASNLIATYALFYWARAEFIFETSMPTPGLHPPSTLAVKKFRVQQSNIRHLSRIWLVVLLQRSGIKEELAAISRHGGQPRS